MPRFENYGLCHHCKIKKDFLICSDCCICICQDCLEQSSHFKCKKCINNATCNFNQLCYDCQINHYDMINDFIAIGDCESSYDIFDIIVNLFVEENGCELNEIILKEENNKKIYKVGLVDKPEYKDNALYLLTSLIPKLVIEKNKKILFHCYAGISRSVTFAIAYLMVINNLSVESAYNLIKSKRSCIQPNYGFIQTLNEFHKIIKNI